MSGFIHELQQIEQLKLFVLEAPDGRYPCTTMAAVRSIMSQFYPHVNLRSWRDCKKDIGYMAIINVGEEEYKLTVSALYKYCAPNKGKWDRRAIRTNEPDK